MWMYGKPGLFELYLSGLLLLDAQLQLNLRPFSLILHFSLNVLFLLAFLP